MAAPPLTPDMKPQIGKFYMVPCARITPSELSHGAEDSAGWIPLIGPEHHDRDTIGFSAMHIHVDVRFMSEIAANSYAIWNSVGMPGAQRAMGHPLSTWSDGVGGPPVKQLRKELRRKKCLREMPDFPVSLAGKWMPALERAHACTKLKPGNICPHRGIDLTPFIKDDGTVICPGHGLRWDTKTGELLPHPKEVL